jgi:sterol desaturase/sphingolipid hydroxylase (fatty acid hydroxylase superfamily)
MLRATPDSPRMFESDFIDFFSRTHPVVVPLLYVPASTYLCWYSVRVQEVGVGLTALLVAAGLLSWTLCEYWLHRLFFHWVPKGAWGDRLHFLVHGVHHKWPHDRYRLVMPPAVSITLFVVFISLFVVVFGRYGWAFHAGYTVGYMYYDLTHYCLHHFRPTTAYGVRLKKHHMLHHFKDSDCRYGVSSKLWDYVFGTTGS